MKQTIIKGAFVDCINRIIFLNEKSIPYWFKIKEITVDNDSSNIEIMNLFQSSLSYVIQDDTIVFKIKRTESELDKYKEEKIISLRNSILQLKKWFNMNIENKNQIETYLQKKELNWILDQLINTK